MGLVKCCFCGERIKCGEKWHLAHAEIRGAHTAQRYAGPSHVKCNVAAANGKHHPPPPRAPALSIFD
jgi:hypothetical protein